MDLNFNSERPIFQQIAEGIEDSILSGVFPEESQIPSITEFSVQYKINPATALKGINLLVDEGMIYKKRGLGMFVAQGAMEALGKKRKAGFYEKFVASLVKEARRLGIGKEELDVMLEKGFSEGEKDKEGEVVL